MKVIMLDFTASRLPPSELYVLELNAFTSMFAALTAPAKSLAASSDIMPLVTSAMSILFSLIKS